MQVSVREISALRQFRVSLDQFRDASNEAISLARHELDEILALIEERQAVWRQQISSFEEEAEQARSDMRRCEEWEDDGEDGYERDCSEYEEAFSHSLRRRHAAEEELAAVLRWQQEVLDGAETFEKATQQLTYLTESDFERGRNFLQDKAAALENYASADGLPAPSFQTVAQGTGPSGAESTTPKSGDPAWRERGVCEVSLGAIDLTDCSKDALDFRKVSYERMRDGIQKLTAEVWPAVKRGAGREYFERLDREAAIGYEHGLVRVYDAFFGMEPIRLERQGEHYVVVNGRHRLAVARDLGVTSLPASVTEKSGSSRAISQAE